MTDPDAPKVNLTKGDNVDLVVNLQKVTGDDGASLKSVIVELSWLKDDTGHNHDLDLSAFGLQDDGGHGRILPGVGVDDTPAHDPCPDWFVFYNHLRAPNNAIVHSGDQTEGGVERLKIDFTKLPDDLDAISCITTIDGAPGNGQTFGQVANAVAKVIDEKTGQVLATIDLTDDKALESALELLKFYRKGSSWKLKNVSTGFPEGLSGFTRRYGFASANRPA